MNYLIGIVQLMPRKWRSHAWPENAKGRLMLTMAAAAGKRGYGATRVSDLLDGTGISRRTFYVYFANREDCFFATYDAIVSDVSELFDDGDPDLRPLLSRLLDYFTDWPDHARVLLIEILATGPSGAERHEQTTALLADRLAASPRLRPGGSGTPNRPELAQAAAGVLLRLVQRQLVTEGGAALPGLLPGLVAMTTQLRVAA